MRGRTGGGNAPIRERDFHGWLRRALPAGRTGLLPLGDDAAALPVPPGRVAVISTDTLVEGTHFLPASPPERVGRAAAAVSLSDVAAKGAEPVAVLLAMIVPAGTPRRWAEAIARGAEDLSSRFGAHVVGGDTKPGPVRAIASTVIGWGRARALAPRSGARPGDVLVTTGAVGRGGVAAARLGAGGAVARRALAAILDVRPRVREGIALGRFADAMIDTSDGLADASRLLAEASGVRLVVEEARLPLAAGVRSLAHAPSGRRAIAFYGGDYEILAAVPARRLRAAVRAVRHVGGDLTRIGRVAAGRGAWLVTGGRPGPMPPAGWQPFGRREPPTG